LLEFFERLPNIDDTLFLLFHPGPCKDGDASHFGDVTALDRVPDRISVRWLRTVPCGNCAGTLAAR
jgi:hypothetical protein